MAVGENESALGFIRATPYTASATINGEVIRALPTALASIIISSHSALTFKLWNSATGPGNPIGSTYTPAAGSSVLNFSVPIEFTNGLYLTTAGQFGGGVGGGSGLVLNIE